MLFLNHWREDPQLAPMPFGSVPRGIEAEGRLRGGVLGLDEALPLHLCIEGALRDAQDARGVSCALRAETAAQVPLRLIDRPLTLPARTTELSVIIRRQQQQLHLARE